MSKLGSGVDEVIFAVLVIVTVADDDTVPLINIVLVPPLSNVPISKLPGHGLKVTPPSIENSSPIISGEMKSVKTTFWAFDGPAFDTLIV